MTKKRLSASYLTACLLLAAINSGAADWPQWRGPNRDGISPETGWNPELLKEGMKPAWEENVGAGYSAVSIADERLYTAGNFEGLVGVSDVVVCLNPRTGKRLWKYSYSSDKGSYAGPRATPTVDGDRVYMFSRHGDLICLSADKGEEIWKKNVREEHGIKPEPREWGLACSPVVVDENLILDLGKILVLDKNSGALRYEMGADPPAFSSPVLFKAHGRELVTSLNSFGLVIYDIAQRREFTRQPWEAEWDANAMTPIVNDGRIFLTSGYERGCGLFKVTATGLEEIYRSDAISSEASNCVLYEGHVYGVSGEFGKSGHLKCVEFATGREKWASPRQWVGGGVMIAGNKILNMQGNGVLSIAEATADSYKELAAAKVIEKDRTWTMPTLVNGLVYCRSVKGTLVCLDLSSD